MKTTTCDPSLFSITPTVYTGTGDKMSYADITVTARNTGSVSLSVSSIAITLPAALTPANGLDSVIAVAGQPDLWSFGPSQVTAGEFDAAPQSGIGVTLDPNGAWQFTLQMVTLNNAVVLSSVDVTVTAVFADGSSCSSLLNVNMEPTTSAIAFFGSVPAIITDGKSATLNWDCEDINYCIISPVNDGRQPATGSMGVSPAITTVYTLYAYSDGVILSEQCTVIVDTPGVAEFGGLDDNPLQFTVSPATVYISTNPDQSSYANIGITVENMGAAALPVSNIAITLPAGLAELTSLNSITPIASAPDVWYFGLSAFNPGEFDATPATGTHVTINPGDTYQFTLQMVTLNNAVVPSSADVTVSVILAGGSSYPADSFNINIEPAVAGIIFFNARPSSITHGETATLNWQCEEINYCILSPVNNTQQPAQYSMQVSPVTTTEYTLYAYGDGVILSAQWGITVGNPVVVEFGAQGGQTAVAPGDSIVLVWECNQYTTSIDLSASTNVVIPPNLFINGNTPQSGSILVGPVNEQTIFSLMAYGMNGQFSPSTTLINTLVINNFEITPALISPNNGSNQCTLAWNVPAQMVSIDNGIGQVSGIGTCVVNAPADGTIFTLTAGTMHNPSIVTQTVQVANAFGPYTVTDVNIYPGYPGFPFTAYFYAVSDPQNYLSDLSGFKGDISLDGYIILSATISNNGGQLGFEAINNEPDPVDPPDLPEQAVRTDLGTITIVD